MKHKFSLNTFRMLSQLVILALVLGYLDARPALATPSYTMIDLGTLGGNVSKPIAINNAGQVIFNADTSTLDTHGVVWTDAGRFDLNAWGGRNSWAVAMNENGLVTGYSSWVADEREWCCRAFLWQPGMEKPQDLGSLGSGYSRAVAINKNGWVTGYSDLADGSTHAFLSDGRAIIDLGTLPGGTRSIPVAINGQGQVIGNSSLVIDGTVKCCHAFLWQPGMESPQDLTPDGYTSSQPVDINEAGQVLVNAWVDNQHPSRAVVWKGGEVSLVGDPDSPSTIGVAINEAGQVIGNTYLEIYPRQIVHAFFWTKAAGITDLQTLGGHSSWAVAINEAGQVIGRSVLSGSQYHIGAFFWQEGTGLINLGHLGCGSSNPVAINESGQVAGTSCLWNGNKRAFLWEQGMAAPMDLHALNGDASEALAINDQGQVIGSVLMGNNVAHAFVTTLDPNTSIIILGETQPLSHDVSVAPQVVAPLVSYSVYLAPHQSMRKSFPGVNSGPVMFNNTQGTSMIAAERVIYKANGVPTSYSEMMALPASQWDTTHWLPWYNNKDLDTQLRFANPLGLPATVHIYIGGTEMAGSPFTLAGRTSTRKSFPGINHGPVKIVSDLPIVAAERVIYKVNGVGTSFTEMMALPNNQLDSTYWLPWYNNVDLDTQLRFANVSDSPATVHVYIGETEMAGSPFMLAAGTSTRQSFPGINHGPVKVESDQNIVAAERVIYKVNGVNTSFSEMMALSAGHLNTTYWLPWYNNVDLETQLRFANVSSTTATVHVYIGGAEMAGSPFALAAGASMRRSFPSVNNGPVRIESTVNIVAAERVIYKVNGTPASFSELMGLPNSQLNTSYWLPWYNNVDLDTQLRFGIP